MTYRLIAERVTERIFYLRHATNTPPLPESDFLSEILPSIEDLVEETGALTIAEQDRDEARDELHEAQEDLASFKAEVASDIEDAHTHLGSAVIFLDKYRDPLNAESI